MAKAVGVLRWSRKPEVGEVSETEQRERIERAAEENGDELVAVYREPAVSGGSELDKRPGLGPAVAMIEARQVTTIYGAYFDRLFRSLEVQGEVVRRVEEAGGRVFAVDVGEVSNGSAGQWLSAGVLRLVAEYHRRVTGERTHAAKVAAIARGVPTFPRIPPGYRRRDDRALERDPETATIVQGAFGLRAQGAAIKEVQAYLRENGIELGFTGTQKMLSSRIYLGELRFGELHNPHAHEPLIDPALFRRVQQLVVPRGRKAKSERLLARQGILRCGTCGARMVVGQARANGRVYPMYRCPPNGDCPKRVTISATVIEEAVTEAVQDLLTDVHGSASLDDGIAEAEQDLARAEQELDAAVQVFTGLEDVHSTRERLLQLRDVRDAAESRLDELQAATVPSVTVRAGDWDLLTLDERRALVRAVIQRVTVAPGRGLDRVTVEPRRK